MRPLLPLVALLACSSGAYSEATPQAASGVHELVEDGRTEVLAGAMAFAADGAHWMVAGDRDLIVYAGSNETARYTDLGISAEPILALPHGGWVAGARILGADGKVQFDGYGWAERFGRFGHPQAFASSPDGRVAIVAGADAPSMCLCDRGRESKTPNAGALVRLTFREGAPLETVLAEHTGRSDYVVAASVDSIAAATGDQLMVWPARGDGPAVTATVAGGKLEHLWWSGERYLIATRWVDVEHDEVVVFDRALGFAHPTSFVADGNIRALALRPDRHELALAITRYRATTQVWVDEKAIEVVDFAGARHARVDVADYPIAVAWSPDGDTLLASITPEVPLVIRYRVR